MDHGGACVTIAFVVAAPRLIHIAPRKRRRFSGSRNPKGPAQQITIALKPPNLLITLLRARMKPLLR